MNCIAPFGYYSFCPSKKKTNYGVVVTLVFLLLSVSIISGWDYYFQHILHLLYPYLQVWTWDDAESSWEIWISTVVSILSCQLVHDSLVIYFYFVFQIDDVLFILELYLILFLVVHDLWTGSWGEYISLFIFLIDIAEKNCKPIFVVSYKIASVGKWLRWSEFSC